MIESGKEIFKKANLGKLSNRQIIKYGKIGDNIGYEMTKINNTEIYGLSFVEKIDDKYIYDIEKYVEGTLQEMIDYVSICENEKSLVKFQKAIDKQ